MLDENKGGKSIQKVTKGKTKTRRRVKRSDSVRPSQQAATSEDSIKPLSETTTDVDELGACVFLSFSLFHSFPLLKKPVIIGECCNHRVFKPHPPLRQKERSESPCCHHDIVLFVIIVVDSTRTPHPPLGPNAQFSKAFCQNGCSNYPICLSHCGQCCTLR